MVLFQGFDIITFISMIFRVFFLSDQKSGNL